jgi:hypothetical protein
VLRPPHELVGGCELDQATEVHDADLVGHVAHHGEVVRDEQDRQPEPLPELAQQVEDAPGDRRVQSRRDLVGDQQPGTHRERPSQRDTLPLTAGQLPGQHVGVALVQGDQVQQLGHLAAPGRAAEPLARLHRLGEHVADAHPGVERAVRVLEHHLDPPAPGPSSGWVRAGEVLPVQAHGPLVGGDQPHDRPGQRRLAGARLADHADHRPGGHVEVHAVHRGEPVPTRAEPHRQRAHLQ